MPFIDFAQRRVFYRVDLFGPYLSGKRSLLEAIAQHTSQGGDYRLDRLIRSPQPEESRFQLSVALDLIDPALTTRLGGGKFRVTFLLCTESRDPLREGNRQLRNAMDLLVFVADSRAAQLAACLDSLREARYHQETRRPGLAAAPWLFVYNRRDQPDALPVGELDRQFRRTTEPLIEAGSSQGAGALDLLLAIGKMTPPGPPARAP